MRVRWSAQAVARLEALRDFIGERNPAAAGRLVDRIIERAVSLGTFPLRGRSVPDYPAPAIREVIVSRRYRLVYRIEERAVVILTVFDSRRPLPAEDLG